MIVDFCNPLLDATMPCDAAYLAKWHLKNDDAILADSTYQPLINEVVASCGNNLQCGGAIQNSLVMAQWFLQQPGATVMVGAVGDDPNKDLLKKIVEGYGVKTLYQVLPGDFTGCSAILVCDGNRSIVASVAASSRFDFTRWDIPEVLAAVKSAKVVFMSTFFLRSSALTGLAVAAECQAHKVAFAFSLSSPSAIESEAWPALKECYRLSTIVFGNETEALCIGKCLGILAKDATENNVDFNDLCKKLAEWENPTNDRIFVITRGKDPTIACRRGETPVAVPVLELEKSKIVDTNGAGDSFAGGFLAEYTKGSDLKRCIEAGSYVAWNNLQQPGCTQPSTKPNFN